MKDKIIALAIAIIGTVVLLTGLSITTYENEQSILKKSVQLCKADNKRVFVKLKGTLNTYLCKDII